MQLEYNIAWISIWHPFICLETSSQPQTYSNNIAWIKKGIYINIALIKYESKMVENRIINSSMI